MGTLPLELQSDNRDLDDVVDMINAMHEVNADSLVTLGAGSISDACKNVKLGFSNNVSNRDQLLAIKGKINFAEGSVDVPDIPLNPLTTKLICIPTSLSAGEYNPKSGGLDTKTGKKYPYSHPDSMPDVIICDPYLARMTPEWVWLSTGVRSVDHAIETMGNTKIDLNDQSLKEAYDAAGEALGLLMEGLIRSKEDPNDVEARDMCHKGAWKASLAIVRGVPMGGSHAIGHILGPLGVGHGHTSCVMMPAAMRFNYKANSKQQEKIKQILIQKGVVKQLGLDESAEPWQIMAKFVRRIGMPQSLSEVGVHEDRFEKIARDTIGDFWSQTNPIPLNEEMVMEILQYAK